MEVVALLFLFLLIFGSLTLLVVDRRKNQSNQRQWEQRKRETEQRRQEARQRKREAEQRQREAEQEELKRRLRSYRLGRPGDGGRAAPVRPPSTAPPGWAERSDALEHERSGARVHTKPAGSKELRALPYGEYLQTPHWKRKREEKLRAVGRRCQVCNQGPGPLDVHHRTYERLGEELDQDLTALCRSCHHLFHEHGRLSR